MAGGLGIACGAGYYALAGMTLALCLVVTILFTILMDRFPQLGASEAEADAEDGDGEARERRRSTSRQGRIRRIARHAPRG